MILTVEELWNAFSVCPDELEIREFGKNDKLIHNCLDMEMEVSRIEDREVKDFVITLEGMILILKITLGDRPGSATKK